MKTIVFIFVPVVIERTEVRIVAETESSEEQIVTKKDTTDEEVYPFWTWFIENPRPCSTK
jgi:hypothetical protein